MKNNDKKPEYVSTTELAKLLGVSRVAVFKRVKSGKIKAFKIGRNYVIPIEEFWVAVGSFIPQEKKEEIDKVVNKAVKKYGEALRKLGKE